MTVYLGKTPVGIGRIIEKQVAKKKFGATVDTFLGDVDENGVLQKPAEQVDLVFDGIKEIPASRLVNAFASKNSIGFVSFPDLETVGASSLENAFGTSSITGIFIENIKNIKGTRALQDLCYNAKQLTSVTIKSLPETIDQERFFYRAFYTASNLATVDVDFESVKHIKGNHCLYAMFQNDYKVGNEINLGNLETIEGNNTAYYFCTDTGVTSVNLKKLQKISGSSCFASAFAYTKITKADLRKLTTIEGSSACNFMFSSSPIETVNLDSLKEVLGTSGMAYMFANETSAFPIINFPSLTKISYLSALNYMFSNNKRLLEIHFRADKKSLIEQMTGYSSKFGAPNATIYFDLIGTITVNDVAYARNEPNSIYVEDDKTYVAWADESGNIVYTTAGAEPAVGTVVYSDEGTTQVGTVSAVA